MDNFSDEALMIELGQMPPMFILEEIKNKNEMEAKENIEEELNSILSGFQAWSWA